MDEMKQVIRKEFQLDRLILFSDAVIAIAITLLVLEIKIPESRDVISDREILSELYHLFPKFYSFIISFTMIGLYWRVHHRMFGYVTDYNNKILQYNLLFLFFIAILPFSTGLYGNFSGKALVQFNLKVPMTFYGLNLGFIGLSNFLIWSHISNPKNKLTEKPLDRAFVRYTKARSLVVPGIFMLMIIVAWISDVLVALYLPLLIPITLIMIKKRYAKKPVLTSNN